MHGTQNDIVKTNVTGTGRNTSVERTIVTPYIWPNSLLTEHIEEHRPVFVEPVLCDVVRRWLPFAITQQPED
jgi:hypothetical protein